MLVKRKLVESTKSTNKEYINQAHWVVNALAWPQGHSSLWTKSILVNWAHDFIINKLCEIRPQRPWWLPLKVVQGCGILIVPPILGPINNVQVLNFFVGISVQGNNSSVCAYDVSPKSLIMLCFLYSLLILSILIAICLFRSIVRM